MVVQSEPRREFQMQENETNVRQIVPMNMTFLIRRLSLDNPSHHAVLACQNSKEISRSRQLYLQKQILAAEHKGCYLGMQVD